MEVWAAGPINPLNTEVILFIDAEVVELSALSTQSDNRATKYLAVPTA